MGRRFRFQHDCLQRQPFHPSLSVSLAVWLMLRAANPSFLVVFMVKVTTRSDVRLETPAVLFQLLSPRWGGAAGLAGPGKDPLHPAPPQPRNSLRFPEPGPLLTPMTGCFEFPSLSVAPAIPHPGSHAHHCVSPAVNVYMPTCIPTTVPDSPFLCSLRPNRLLAKSSWTAQKSSAY